MARAPTLLVLLGLLASRAPADEVGPYASSQHAADVLSGSRDPAERASAAAWLGAREGPSERRVAEAALRQALLDRASGVRRAAAVALARVAAPESRTALEQALTRERDRDVLPALLLALGGLRDPTTVATLAAWRGDPSPGVRAAALTALGDVGGEPARAALLEGLRAPTGSDPSWAVRSAAILGLARAGRRGDIVPVVAAMRAGDGWAHWLARSAFARAVPTIDSEPLPRLEVLVHDGDARVAVTAAAGFARAGRPERLVALLASPAGSVRAAAAAASAQEQVRAAIPSLERVVRADPELAVRWSAALALFRLGTAAGEAAVLDGLASNEATIWMEAVAALSERTGEQHGRDAGAWRAALARSRPR